MRLTARGLEGGGAVLLDASGVPLPIAPTCFVNEESAVLFLQWLGDDFAGSTSHLRYLATQWGRVVLTDCPTCPPERKGKIVPGESICSACRAEVEADRPTFDHLAEPGRNGTDG